MSNERTAPELRLQFVAQFNKDHPELWEPEYELRGPNGETLPIYLLGIFPGYMQVIYVLVETWEGEGKHNHFRTPIVTGANRVYRSGESESLLPTLFNLLSTTKLP